MANRSSEEFKNDILEAIRPELQDSLTELYGKNPSKALHQLGRSLVARSYNKGAECKIKLYGAQNLCPNTWRADAYLHHFKIPFEQVQIDIMNEENRKPDYLKINPQGVVPTLVDDANGGYSVLESGGILLYLDEVWGKGVGKPTDPKELGKMWELFYRITSNVKSFESGVVVHGREFHVKAAEALLEEYQFLDQEIGEKKFLATDHGPTLVDFAVLPNVSISVLSGLDLKARGLKNLDGWLQRMQELPGVSDGDVKSGWDEQVQKNYGGWDKAPKPWSQVP